MRKMQPRLLSYRRRRRQRLLPSLQRMKLMVQREAAKLRCRE